jgi:hypothetical protein
MTSILILATLGTGLAALAALRPNAIPIRVRTRDRRRADRR